MSRVKQTVAILLAVLILTTLTVSAASALNPQPLPPGLRIPTNELNPQPLPPGLRIPINELVPLQK
jgi:hypothetical protein